MGISFGAGHTASSKPKMSYSAGINNDESLSGSSSDWVPLTKAGGNKSRDTQSRNVRIMRVGIPMILIDFLVL